MSDCGCRIEPAVGGDSQHIVYCPLHAAAAELLSLAKWVADSNILKVVPAIIIESKRLIAKAEGRTK